MLVSLEEAKTYLRVDSSDDDDLIDILLTSARQYCADVARLSPEEALEVETGGGVYYDGRIDEDKHTQEMKEIRKDMRIAELYALGYLYEHREEADHHALMLTLRDILFAVREGRMYEDREAKRKDHDRKMHHGGGRKCKPPRSVG